MEISEDSILDVFRRLGFIYETTEDKIFVTVPTRRLDIAIKEDLIEEVGRIYGLDNIEGKLPTVPMKQGSFAKTRITVNKKRIIVSHF